MALCSDTKTSTTLFLTRRRGDTETHPPRKTEPMIAGRLRLIRTQGHNNKHAHNGIRLRHGAKSVVLCTHSLVNDEEPFWAYGADPTPPLHVKTTSFPSDRSTVRPFDKLTAGEAHGRRSSRQAKLTAGGGAAGRHDKEYFTGPERVHQQYNYHGSVTQVTKKQ
jgi:hypothetical protein